MDATKFKDLIIGFFGGCSDHHQLRSGGIYIQNFLAHVIVSGATVEIRLVRDRNPPHLWDALLVPSPGPEKEARDVSSAEDALSQLASAVL